MNTDKKQIFKYNTKELLPYLTWHVDILIHDVWMYD